MFEIMGVISMTEMDDWQKGRDYVITIMTLSKVYKSSVWEECLRTTQSSTEKFSKLSAPWKIKDPHKKVCPPWIVDCFNTTGFGGIDLGCIANNLSEIYYKVKKSYLIVGLENNHTVVEENIRASDEEICLLSQRYLLNGEILLGGGQDLPYLGDRRCYHIL